MLVSKTLLSFGGKYAAAITNKKSRYQNRKHPSVCHSLEILRKKLPVVHFFLMVGFQISSTSVSTLSLSFAYQNRHYAIRIEEIWASTDFVECSSEGISQLESNHWTNLPDMGQHIFSYYIPIILLSYCPQSLCEAGVSYPIAKVIVVIATRSSSKVLKIWCASPTILLARESGTIGRWDQFRASSQLRLIWGQACQLLGPLYRHLLGFPTSPYIRENWRQLWGDCHVQLYKGTSFEKQTKALLQRAWV